MTGRAKAHRRDGFILAAAVGLIGVTYGVLADTAGLSLAQAMALSVLTFAGSSQFAVVSVVDGGGNAATAVGSALLLAARNCLYGPLVGPVLKGGPTRRVLAAHFVLDETTAMASAQETPADSRDAFWSVSYTHLTLPTILLV